MAGGTPRLIRVGEAFGEVALIKKTARKSTVATDAHCFMWVIDSESFQSLIKQASDNRRTENIQFLKSV